MDIHLPFKLSRVYPPVDTTQLRLAMGRVKTGDPLLPAPISSGFGSIHVGFRVGMDFQNGRSQIWAGLGFGCT